MNKANKQASQKKSVLTDAKSKGDPQTEKRNRILTDANSKSDPQVKTGKAGTPNKK
jgi:hypothetical protein